MSASPVSGSPTIRHDVWLRRGFDVGADSLQVATSDPGLEDASERAADANQRIRGTREGYDLTVCFTHNVKGLLALLWMPWQGAVGETVSTLVVGDGHDSTRRHNPHGPNPHGHDQLGPNLNFGGCP